MMIKVIFGKVIIYRLLTRVDNRGSLEYFFDENTAIIKVRETRIYSMPKEGTFFGIHYREESNPMTKFVTVIRGRGMDSKIGLKLPVPISEISDYDLSAPFVSERGVVGE